MKRYDHKLCIAPMMDYTDTHFRYFLRLLSQDIFLYTEMISADALIHGHRNMLLKFDSSEHPIGLQIGGSSIQKMADAAVIGQDYGYDEINLNIGCPSPRVQKGNFGASLMADSQLVSKIISNIKTKIQIPVTVKCRLGIDDQDIEKDLKTFIKSCIDAGADLLIIHARKAWLNGISAKDNRVLPEINYQAVYDIKNYAKETEIIINGEINSYSDIKNHLKYVDGVMLGRKIIIDPLFLRDADTNIFGNKKQSIKLEDIIEIYSQYADEQIKNGVSKTRIIKPLMSIFNNKPHAKSWRRGLDNYRNNELSPVNGLRSVHEDFVQGFYI